jgi:hypothetical protein
MLTLIRSNCRYVADLIRFGAVFYALECPTPPLSASPEQLELYNRVLKLRASGKKERLSLKGKTLKEAQKANRVTSPSEYIESGTYLRVHVHPKRSPRYFLHLVSFCPSNTLNAEFLKSIGFEYKHYTFCVM